MSPLPTHTRHTTATRRLSSTRPATAVVHHLITQTATLSTSTFWPQRLPKSSVKICTMGSRRRWSHGITIITTTIIIPTTCTPAPAPTGCLHCHSTPTARTCRDHIRTPTRTNSTITTWSTPGPASAHGQTRLSPRLALRLQHSHIEAATATRPPQTTPHTPQQPTRPDFGPTATG